MMLWKHPVFLSLMYFLASQILIECFAITGNKYLGKKCRWRKVKRPQETGILALLSFQEAGNSKEFSTKVVHQILSSITKLVGGESVEALKFSEVHILVEFNNVAAYKKLGRLFMDGQTDSIHGYKLVEIQG